MSGRLGEIRLTDSPASQPWFVLRSAVGPVRATVEEVVAFVHASAQRAVD